METFVKYLIYAALVVVAAFIIQGIWFDEKNDNGVVVEVGEVIPAQQSAMIKNQAQSKGKPSLPTPVQ